MHYLDLGNALGMNALTVGPLLVILLLWSLVWKGLGLWHSARRGEWIWFVIMMLVNTVGILEIVYLFAVAKIKPDKLFSKDS